MSSSQRLSSRGLRRRFEAVARILPASSDCSPPVTGLLISPELILTTLRCWSAAPATATTEERRARAHSAASTSFVQLPWRHASHLLVMAKCRPDVLFVWSESGGYCVCALHPYLRELSTDEELCERSWSQSADGIVLDSFVSLRSAPSRRLMQRLSVSDDRRQSPASSSADSAAVDEQGDCERIADSSEDDDEERMLVFIAQQYDQPQPSLLLPHCSADRPRMSALTRGGGRQLVQYKWHDCISAGSALFDDQWRIVGLTISREPPQQAQCRSSSSSTSSGRVLAAAAVLYTSVLMHSVVDELLLELVDLLPAHERSAGDERLRGARRCLLLVQAMAFQERESLQRWLLERPQQQRELEALLAQTACSLDSLQQTRPTRLTRVQLLPVFEAVRCSEEPDINNVGGGDWFARALSESLRSGGARSAVPANLWTSSVMHRFLELNTALLGDANVRELSTGFPGPVQRSQLQHMNAMFHMTDSGEREQWLCEHVYTSAEKRSLLIIALSSPQSGAAAEATARSSEALCQLAERLSTGSGVRWPHEVQADAANITLLPCAPEPSTLDWSDRTGQGDDDGGDDWLSRVVCKSMASGGAPPAVPANAWTSSVVDRFLMLNKALLGEVRVAELSTGSPGPMQRSRLRSMNPMFHLTDSGEREQWLCQHVYTSCERRSLLTLALSSAQPPASDAAVAQPSAALCELAQRLATGSGVRWPDEIKAEMAYLTLVPCAPDPWTMDYRDC